MTALPYSNKPKHKPRGILDYTSYNFIDKDPVIYALWDATVGAGIPLGRVARDSGVPLATLQRWFWGTTKRPAHAGLRAVCRAIGRDLAIIDGPERLHRVITMPKPAPRSRARLRIIQGGKPAEPKWKRRASERRAIRQARQ
jgi:hypothetical protein